ncbi:TPA: hypothetical protein DIU27_02300 [Candidatus Collierbacteria bacterium]|uniref:Uncharacterized protein n=1 Tax=Candidatus Collierbacteria bacterium GW2011_GWB2_44_22 TaxID=1618387 RepID=A0A0G1HXV6_9BACT|nr:MAG: hypothetical protein UW31_C0009G0052 [Candidatus Collierbacteria bacterium GW2011_GWA2_44_13]KKT51195.1 MAG: hypothetical protein UW42_C0005G0003 [Candidatus Collierbacteria bacterium GW2011_GWB1_44_197]KKT51976.1 MAG: hypothetical protein UW44_C0005G0018 [Candidatus Collierbacteria bacterium GW2011_GWB2_44_22]KKT62272.1 MAG: hypothetical protein UW56_C0009G0046 [Candidatus Collierbacteria bacterium GW2011_GWD1_44_27]KKT66618.1 MAG: hypothetical protein UW58_C0005G0014 [Candidatus Colli
MTEKESFWEKERGTHLLKVSDKAARMVAERINLEILNLRLINLPLCTEKEAVYIEELIPRAKEGFALAMKADRISPSDLIDLYRLTIPETSTGIWRQVKLTDRQNTLPEYGHVVATLSLLLEMGRVTYFDFSSPPLEVDARLGKAESYWYSMSTSPEKIWTFMEELEVNIRAALYQKDPIGSSELLKVGHFFSAAKEIAEIFAQ